MNGYRDLEIYTTAFELSIKVHELTLNLPSYEFLEGGRQIRRSSKSISSNIVEGYGRKRYKADFIRFLIYANASCDETLGHLEVLSAIHFKNEPLTSIIDDYKLLGRKIYSFIKYLEKNWR